MSMEKVREFYEKVNADKGLQEKIAAVAKDDPNNLGAFVFQTAKENGFEFTEEEMKAFMKEKAEQFKSGQELSDSELEAVAGGGKEHWIVESIASFGTVCAASAISRETMGGCTLDEDNCGGQYSY